MLSTDEKNLFSKHLWKQTLFCKIWISQKIQPSPFSSKLIPSRFVTWRISSKKFDVEASVLPDRHKGLTYRSRKADKVKTVKDIVADNPSIYIRHCSAMTGYSKSCIQKVIKKDLKMKSYNASVTSLHVHMKEGDPHRRIIFSNDLLKRGNDFINTIEFSNASTFNLNVKVSNMGYRASYNIFLHNNRNSTKPSSTQCPVQEFKGRTFFKSENVKAGDYLHMLKYWRLPQLENDIIFLYDGAQPY